MKYLGKNFVAAYDESGKIMGLYNTAPYVKYINDSDVNEGYNKDFLDVTGSVLTTAVASAFVGTGKLVESIGDVFTNITQNRGGVTSPDKTRGVGMRRED